MGAGGCSRDRSNNVMTRSLTNPPILLYLNSCIHYLIIINWIYSKISQFLRILAESSPKFQQKYATR